MNDGPATANAPPAGSGAPVALVYSTADKDEPLRDGFRGHLRLLERHGSLAPWPDRRIGPDEDRAGRVGENLLRGAVRRLDGAQPTRGHPGLNTRSARRCCRQT